MQCPHGEIPEITLAARLAHISIAKLSYTATKDDGEMYGGQEAYPMISILGKTLPDPGEGAIFVGHDDLQGHPDLFLRITLEFDEVRLFAEHLLAVIAECEEG